MCECLGTAAEEASHNGDSGASSSPSAPPGRPTQNTADDAGFASAMAGAEEVEYAAKCFDNSDQGLGIIFSYTYIYVYMERDM